MIIIILKFSTLVCQCCPMYIVTIGDEILEIHGTTVTNKSVDEIVQIIRECPDEFLATVRPLVSVRKPNDPQILEGLHQKTNYTRLFFPDSQATDRDPPDEEDINEALECVQDNESAPPLSPSPPPIPPHTKESYILLESVNTLNNHAGRDYNHRYPPLEPVNNPASRDYKPVSNGTDKLKRRPHVYEEIDTKFNPVVKTNGMPSGAKMSRSTPDVLTYADLDFRQQ